MVKFDFTTLSLSTEQATLLQEQLLTSALLPFVWQAVLPRFVTLLVFLFLILLSQVFLSTRLPPTLRDVPLLPKLGCLSSNYLMMQPKHQPQPDHVLSK
jgi:hypothetical protein